MEMTHPNLAEPEPKRDKFLICSGSAERCGRTVSKYGVFNKLLLMSSKCKNMRIRDLVYRLPGYCGEQAKPSGSVLSF